TAERGLEAGTAHRQPYPLQPLQLDLGRPEVGVRPLEVAVRALICAVVADVDLPEPERRAAAGAGAGVGSVRELFGGGARVVQAVPEGRPGQVEPDLPNTRVVRVEDGPAALRQALEGLV